MSCLAQQLSEMAEAAFQLQGRHFGRRLKAGSRLFASARYGGGWMVAELLWIPFSLRHSVRQPFADCDHNIGDGPSFLGFAEGGYASSGCFYPFCSFCLFVMMQRSNFSNYSPLHPVFWFKSVILEACLQAGEGVASPL